MCKPGQTQAMLKNPKFKHPLIFLHGGKKKWSELLVATERCCFVWKENKNKINKTRIKILKRIKQSSSTMKKKFFEKKQQNSENV